MIIVIEKNKQIKVNDRWTNQWMEMDMKSQQQFRQKTPVLCPLAKQTNCNKKLLYVIFYFT